VAGRLLCGLWVGVQAARRAVVLILVVLILVR